MTLETQMNLYVPPQRPKNGHWVQTVPLAVQWLAIIIAPIQAFCAIVLTNSGVWQHGVCIQSECRRCWVPPQMIKSPSTQHAARCHAGAFHRQENDRWQGLAAQVGSHRADAHAEGKPPQEPGPGAPPAANYQRGGSTRAGCCPCPCCCCCCEVLTIRSFDSAARRRQLWLSHCHCGGPLLAARLTSKALVG